LKEIEACNLVRPGVLEKIVSVIGSFHGKKLTANSDLFRKINDGKYSLNVTTLTVDDHRDHVEVLCLKDFSASEIEFRNVQISTVLESIQAANEEGRLNPGLKEVNKWTIQVRSNDEDSDEDNEDEDNEEDHEEDNGKQLELLLQLSRVLKAISPKMKEFSISFDSCFYCRHSLRSKDFFDGADSNPRCMSFEKFYNESVYRRQCSPKEVMCTVGFCIS
ncbi:hypothetical protein FO519_008760, partial [Halicephalobus sp. NKZ332]